MNFDFNTLMQLVTQQPMVGNAVEVLLAGIVDALGQVLDLNDVKQIATVLHEHSPSFAASVTLHTIAEDAAPEGGPHNVGEPLVRPDETKGQ